MCHFITVVLPPHADPEALLPIFERHGRRLTPQQNLSVESQLAAGERYFLTTVGMCDCGTTLGSTAHLKRTHDEQKGALANAETKLRRAGWSDAKFARWREEKEKRLERPIHHIPGTDWMGLINDVLGSGHTRSIAILLHWYSGPLTERIELKERRAMAAASLTSDDLRNLLEDVLYEFRAPA